MNLQDFKPQLSAQTTAGHHKTESIHYVDLQHWLDMEMRLLLNLIEAVQIECTPTTTGVHKKTGNRYRSQPWGDLQPGRKEVQVIYILYGASNLAL